MKKYQRALGSAVAIAAVSAGLATGAAPAQAAPTTTVNSSTTDGLLDGLLGALTLTPTSLPVLSGVPGVDSLLSLTAPVWNLLDVTNSVQWFADGVAIPGATDWSFIPGADQAGQTIQAIVTGSVLGLLPVQAVSNLIQIPGLGSGGTGTGTGTGTDNPLSALQMPSLTGIPGVGSLLQILDPVWSLPGVSTAYQWFVDGVAVPGATDPTYIPGLSDAGKEIYATITGTLAGLPVVNLLTAKMAIPTTTDQEMQASSAPSVSGTAQVGKALTASDPTWNTDGVTSTYQWFRETTAISGATSKSYTATAEDMGHQVSVKVTGTKEGYTDATAASNAVTVAQGDAPTYTTQPAVSGTYAVGSVLTATPGAWGSGTTPTYTYQWKRDTVAVSGATSSTYSVTTADIGHGLSVTVTATRTGYKPGSFTTSTVSVDKLASTVTASLTKKKIKVGKRGTLLVTLSTPGTTPSGEVRVYDGRVKIATKAAASSLSFKLPKLKAGAHNLRAVFMGSDTYNPSISKAATLKVKKVKKSKKHKH